MTNIVSCKQGTTTGSEFSPLHSTGAVCHKDVYVCGGLNTHTMNTSNEMYILKRTGKGSGDQWHVETVQENSPLSISPRKQLGQAPSGRSGHTMVALNNNSFLMFGGLCFDKQDSSGQEMTSLFSQVCNDGSFYICNTDTLTWTKLDDIPYIAPRCYRTLTSWVSNSDTYVAVNGGIKYHDRRPVERLPINQFVVLKFESQSIANYSIREVVIPMIENDLKFFLYNTGWLQPMHSNNRQPGTSVEQQNVQV